MTAAKKVYIFVSEMVVSRACKDVFILKAKGMILIIDA